MSKPKLTLVRTADGFIENALTNNIVLVQAMGICPIIAAGTTLKNGVVLTICSALILLPLTLFSTYLGERIPRWLRPVVYVVMASVLLMGGSFLLSRYIAPELHAHLAIYIPLMAVNMMYTRTVNRAVMAGPAEAVLDALGSTVGFGLVICVMSTLREMTGFGTIWDVPLNIPVKLPEVSRPFVAFILLGFMSAVFQWLRRRIRQRQKEKEAKEAARDE